MIYGAVPAAPPVPPALPAPSKAPLALAPLMVGVLGLGLLFVFSEEAEKGKRRAAANPKKKKMGPEWWTAVVIGTGLVLFPEPATTATGLAILAGTLGYRALA